jgi:hypothetical protein
MDTSPEYINMCEKATEIQKTRRNGWAIWEVGDFIWSPKQEDVLIILPFDGNDNLAWNVSGSRVVIRDHHEAQYGIWLPRQDQLQEIVRGERHMHLLAYEFAAYFHGTVDPLCQYLGRDNYTVDSDNSMEQMWLAYVMKTKYNKVWNGEDWIAAK